MTCSFRVLYAAALLAAGMSVTSIQAEPLIRDANGLAVASPAGLAGSGVLMGYLTVDGVTTSVLFQQTNQSSAVLQWFGGSGLYYKTSDCSGPAFISPNPLSMLGTHPSVLTIGENETLLHIADSMESAGKVKVQSYRSGGEECRSGDGHLKGAWRARPAIDLRAMFTPPFSVR